MTGVIIEEDGGSGSQDSIDFLCFPIMLASTERTLSTVCPMDQKMIITSHIVSSQVTTLGVKKNLLVTFSDGVRPTITLFVGNLNQLR